MLLLHGWLLLSVELRGRRRGKILSLRLRWLLLLLHGVLGRRGILQGWLPGSTRTKGILGRRRQIRLRRGVSAHARLNRRHRPLMGAMLSVCRLLVAVQSEKRQGARRCHFGGLRACQLWLRLTGQRRLCELVVLDELLVAGGELLLGAQLLEARGRDVAVAGLPARRRAGLGIRHICLDLPAGNQDARVAVHTCSAYTPIIPLSLLSQCGRV